MFYICYKYLFFKGMPRQLGNSNTKRSLFVFTPIFSKWLIVYVCLPFPDKMFSEPFPDRINVYWNFILDINTPLNVKTSAFISFLSKLLNKTAVCKRTSWLSTYNLTCPRDHYSYFISLGTSIVWLLSTLMNLQDSVTNNLWIPIGFCEHFVHWIV